MSQEFKVSDLPTLTPGSEAGAEDVRSIGDIIRDSRNLSADQVEKILAYQRSHGVRFGEAAIALGLATPDDVLHALARQFNYAYGSAERAKTSPELVSLNHPFSLQAEAFRAIRAQVLLRTHPADAQGAPIAKRAVAVVSPNKGDGKTFFSANLAVALAQLGGRTLLIDGDLRGARLHEVLGVETTGGLVGLLSGRKGEKVVLPVKGVPNLFVLPVGISPPNPMELLEGPGFGVLLQELLGKFDHVLIDTPAAEYGADGLVVAARCGVALIVARKDQAQVKALQDLVRDLDAAQTSIVGVVMNEY